MPPVRVHGGLSARLPATPNPVHASQTPKCIKEGLNINTIMRCAKCKKKLSVVTFTCTCEKTYCLTCRLPEDHACPAQVKLPVVLPPAVIRVKVEQL